MNLENGFRNKKRIWCASRWSWYCAEYISFFDGIDLQNVDKITCVNQEIYEEVDAYLYDSSLKNASDDIIDKLRSKTIVYIDDYPPKVKEHQTVITNISHFHNRNSRSYNFLAGHQKKELYILEKDYIRFSDSNYKLHYFFHTPTMALNWAYLKGFKNVVLAGVDLNINDLRHFDNEKFNPNWLEKDVQKARNHLENICTKYLDIYQLNAGSDLRLPKLKLGDLLCQEFC